MSSFTSASSAGAHSATATTGENKPYSPDSPRQTQALMERRDEVYDPAHMYCNWTLAPRNRIPKSHTSCVEFNMFRKILYAENTNRNSQFYGHSSPAFYETSILPPSLGISEARNRKMRTQQPTNMSHITLPTTNLLSINPVDKLFTSKKAAEFVDVIAIKGTNANLLPIGTPLHNIGARTILRRVTSPKPVTNRTTVFCGIAKSWNRAHHTTAHDTRAIGPFSKAAVSEYQAAQRRNVAKESKGLPRDKRGRRLRAGRSSLGNEIRVEDLESEDEEESEDENDAEDVGDEIEEDEEGEESEESDNEMSEDELREWKSRAAPRRV